MKKTITFLFFSCLFSTFLFSQYPEPCEPVPGGIPPGDTPPGCMVCSVAWSGSNQGYTAGPPGSAGFPCGTIENNMFLSIVVDAGGTLNATILSTGCLAGQGVQIMIYDTQFNPVSNCFSSGGLNLPGNIVASGLTPGDIYWIMIDGFAGDICDILFTVNGGASWGFPQPIGQIEANPSYTNLCPGSIVEYSIPTQSSIGELFEWNVPGNSRILAGGGGQDNFVKVIYDQPGGGVVQVSLTNPCNDGIPSILPVSVLPILPTLNTPVSFCTEEFPVMLDGYVFDNPGNYTFTVQNSRGCDSVSSYIILEHVSVPGILDTTICLGQSVTINQIDYSTPGTYPITLPNANNNGCDSLVNMILSVNSSNLTFAPVDTLDCLVASTSALEILNPQPLQQYQWSSLGGGNIITRTDSSAILVDEPGRYILNVTSSTANCTTIDTFIVERKGAPRVPILDTIENFNCAGDLGLFKFPFLFDTDSLLWTFVGLDTFRTAVVDSFYYQPIGRFDSLLIQGENRCGLGASLDSTIQLTPSDDPSFSLSANEVCISTPVILTASAIAQGVDREWNTNGGTLNNINQNTFEALWQTSGLKTISQTLVEGNCRSFPERETIRVEAPFDALNISCQESADQVRFQWDIPSGNPQLSPSVITSQQGTLSGNAYTFSNLSAAEEVTLQIEVSGNSCAPQIETHTCSTLDCPPRNVFINVPQNPICIDFGTLMRLEPLGVSSSGTTSWSGTAVSPTGFFDPLAAGPGTHEVVLTYDEGNGCIYASSEFIEVIDIPFVDFDLAASICIDETATLDYQGQMDPSLDYQWNFGGAIATPSTGFENYELSFPGPGFYRISLIAQTQGCISNLIAKTITVEGNLPDLDIDCNASIDEVTFEWQDVGATSYQVNSISGQTGVLSGTSYTVSNLTAGETIEIEVVAFSSSSCGSTTTTSQCSATTCPQVDVQITPVPTVCFDGSNPPIQLEANIIGANANGSLSWSGNGVNANGIFNPQTVGIGQYLITAQYSELNCTYESDIRLNVRQVPTSDFTAPAAICESDQATILFTGVASPSANYNWDFGNASSVNNTGSTSFQVSYPSAGNNNVTLTVDDLGCVSTTTSETIQVDPILDLPQVNCNASFGQITFSWLDVPFANAYQVQSLTGQVGVRNGNSISFDNLGPNELVSVRVEAEGNTLCGISFMDESCTSLPCPQIGLSIDPISTGICPGDDLNIQLTANATGGIGSGTFNWSGDSISADGILTTKDLTSGLYSIYLDYQEGGCSYSTSGNYEVFEAPKLAPNYLSPIWYPGTATSVSLNVSDGLAPYKFNWSNQDSTNALIDVLPGDYCVTVSDQNGCEIKDCYSLSSGIYKVSPIRVICQNESVELNIRPGRGANFKWSPSSGLSCDDCAEPIVSPSRSTVYSVKATLPNGRADSTPVSIIVLPLFACVSNLDDNTPDFYRIENQLETHLKEGMALKDLEQFAIDLVQLSQNDVTIFPNPTSGKVQIDSPTFVEWVHVFDISGREILNSTKVEIDLSKEAAGVYFFKVKTEKGVVTKRVVLF